jgi:predicted Zn-dependent peptidase
MKTQKRMTTRTSPCALAFAAALLTAPAPASAAPIAPHPDKLAFKPFTYVPPRAQEHRAVLPATGVPAYVAVDRELPLITIQVHVRVGEYLQPRGKEGLADLTGYLMARGGVDGKRPYDAQALEERLAYLAANLNTQIGDTQGLVSLNLLSKDLDEGLAILRDVLSAPRFEEGRLKLRKDQMLNEMRQRNDDSAHIEARERRFLAFGADHFTNQHVTKASLEGLTRADLQAFHRRYFHPGNFIVTAAGDFDRDTMLRKLDALLAGWPYKGDIVKAEIPKPSARPAPGLYLIHKGDVTQGRVSIFSPGILRDDPDYYAVQVMNAILGGGGFISRITNRVRSDEGLAYSAGSRFAGGVYYPDVFLAAFQSKLRSCGYATQLVLEEMAGMQKAQVKGEEMLAAKKQLVEGLPRLFRTKAQVVDVLASEEFTGRYQKDPEYWRRYQERIERVTAADVQRVAQKWLDDKGVAILVVGKREELLNPDPRHPVKLQDLARGLKGGKFIELPLRDPMTMKPMASPPASPAPSAPAAAK